MSTRRSVHTSRRYRPEINAGLWLEKFIESSARKQRGGEAEGGTSQARLAEEMSRSTVPALYATSYDRWKQALAAHRAYTAPAAVLGRMIVGLGAESVMETAVTLHRTYGVPLIPGSALKGLAAACARQVFGEDWAQGSAAYTIMFGTTETAGYLTFFDALYIPGSVAGDRPLAADVLTVHHSEYYGGKDQPPADWDSPTPVPFVSAHGSYLLAVAGPPEQPAWAERAMQILAWGLAERGIGAKTSSGYGRMQVAGVERPEAILARQQATSDQASASGPPAASSSGVAVRRMPGVGDVFAGTVEERGDHKLALSVPGFAPSAAIAVMDITPETPAAWIKGARARVEVMTVAQHEERTVLTVRRAPRERKS